MYGKEGIVKKKSSCKLKYLAACFGSPIKEPSSGNETEREN